MFGKQVTKNIEWVSICLTCATFLSSHSYLVSPAVHFLTYVVFCKAGPFSIKIFTHLFLSAYFTITML